MSRARQEDFHREVHQQRVAGQPQRNGGAVAGAHLKGPVCGQTVGMTRTRAWIGTTMFLFAAPGVVAGLLPWWITGWVPGARTPALVALGWVLVVSGTAALLSAFARFVLDGRGTPAPVAPTEQLVVAGLYRYVRNPMYLAVAAVIVGQALVLGRPVLLLYTGVFLVVVVAFVRVYEEPTLAARYGAEYEEYRATVPGWLPRPRRRPPATRP
ncbi:MAG: isoprenylcysteine carboxylmethyltransferase family protein [Lapillicoccus sp.]